MKKIGEGYYYNVYKINDRRVVKVIKNKIQIFLFIFFANKCNYKNTIVEYKNVIKSIPRLREEYLKILALVEDREVIGNPEFLNEVEYWQDLVKGLRNINTLTEQDFVGVVNDYIHLLKKLWSVGLSDTVFNLSINCGYNEHKRLVLIDFNEMTLSRAEVEKQIHNQVWLKRASYTRLTSEKQDLFRELMRKEVTIESLNTSWLRR